MKLFSLAIILVTAFIEPCFAQNQEHGGDSVSYNLQTEGFITNDPDTVNREIPTCKGGACYGIAKVISITNATNITYNPRSTTRDNAITVRQKLEVASLGYPVTINGYSGPSDLSTKQYDTIKSMAEAIQRVHTREFPVGQKYFAENPDRKPSADDRGSNFVRSLEGIIASGPKSLSPVFLLGSEKAGHALNVSKVEHLPDGSFKITASDRNMTNRQNPNLQYTYLVNPDGKIIQTGGKPIDVGGEISWGVMQSSAEQPKFEDIVKDHPDFPGFGDLYRKTESIAITPDHTQPPNATDSNLFIEPVRGNASSNPAVKTMIQQLVVDVNARSYRFDQRTNSYQIQRANGSWANVGAREVGRFTKDADGNPSYSWSMAVEIVGSPNSAQAEPRKFIEYAINDGKFTRNGDFTVPLDPVKPEAPSPDPTNVTAR
jgi:hypothetical protein